MATNDLLKYKSLFEYEEKIIDNSVLSIAIVDPSDLTLLYYKISYEFDSWCSLLPSPNDIADVDIPLYHRLRKKWQKLQNHGLDRVNLRENLGNRIILEEPSSNNHSDWEDTIIHKELPKIVDKLKTNSSIDDKFRIYKYHPLDEIYTWLLKLKHNNSQHMSVMNLGYSVEKRPILLVEISGMRREINNKLPIIWIQGGTHAREWISVSTSLCLISRLLSVYVLHDSASSVRYLFSKFRFFVIPILNPDGYVHSWRSNRLWRKNRSRANLYCDGVDLNRNWGLHWSNRDNYVLINEKSQTGDNLKLKCSEDFSGPYPFSEPETRAVANYAMMWQPYIRAAIEFHNPGQVVMYPWAWTKTPPKHKRDLKMAAKLMVDAIKLATGSVYSYGQISRILYKAPGCSIDWFYGTLGIKYSYGIELSDLGERGFIINSNETKSTCKEMIRAITTLAYIISNEEEV